MKLRTLAAAAALVVAGTTAFAGPLAAGDLFIYRVGDGAAALGSTATAVFIDEYTTSGSFVQSIAMPTTTIGANGALTASGSATSEGGLSVSADGRFLVFGGYNAALGTTGVASSSAARTVGLLNGAGSVNTTTLLTDAGSNNLRSAASVDGSSVWVGSAATGVRYASTGATTSTQLSTTVANVRNVEIFGNQLYTSSSSGSTIRLGAVGTGLPTTSGQVITNLPGFAASTGSPYAFFFADLSSSVAGLDTLYVADDTASTGGVSKYSLVGSSWVSNGTVPGTTIRGLTGSVSGNTVSLFATGGAALSAITDASGYNGSFTGSLTTLASAGTNTAFRGVAFLAPLAPVPEPQTWALLMAGLGVVVAGARRRA
jgi:hypothetical protein